MNIGTRWRKEGGSRGMLYPCFVGNANDPVRLFSVTAVVWLYQTIELCISFITIVTINK